MEQFRSRSARESLDEKEVGLFLINSLSKTGSKKSSKVYKSINNTARYAKKHTIINLVYKWHKSCSTNSRRLIYSSLKIFCSICLDFHNYYICIDFFRVLFHSIAFT